MSCLLMDTRTVLYTRTAPCTYHRMVLTTLEVAKATVGIPSERVSEGIKGLDCVYVCLFTHRVASHMRVGPEGPAHPEPT